MNPRASQTAMHTFFHGWRRKAGVATLVMALALMGGWLRSYARWDFVQVNGQPWRYAIESAVGNLRLIRTTPIASTPLLGFDSGGLKGLAHINVDDNGITTYEPGYSVGTVWRFDWHTFHISDNMVDRNSLSFRVGVCAAPYWSVTIPLTLLSAYLILWKPRKRGH
jgi:hypothetical protein